MGLIGGSKLTREMQRLKSTGKIDGSIGSKNVGKILDFHNQGVENQRQKRFNKDVSDRNQYYWKLWKRATEEVRSGHRKAVKLNPRKVFY